MVERELPPSWDGSVVLDIGGDVGALVLHVSAVLNGEEIGLDACDPTIPHIHSAVRERRLAHGSSYAAVFPSLMAGLYAIEGSNQLVTIVGGQVTDVHYELEQKNLRIRTLSRDGKIAPITSAT